MSTDFMVEALSVGATAIREQMAAMFIPGAELVKPWFTDWDTSNFPPDIASAISAIMQRLDAFQAQLQAESDALTAKIKVLTDLRDRELLLTVDLMKRVSIISKCLADASPILQQLLAVSNRQQFLTEMRFGIWSLCASYENMEPASQIDWNRWMIELSKTLYAKDLDSYLKDLPPDKNPDVFSKLQAAFSHVAGSEKLSPEFLTKVGAIARKYGLNAAHLLAVMSFETGETFSPAIENKAGSGAVGLIQFTKIAADRLNTTTEALSAMTAMEQLDWVDRYIGLDAKKLRPGSLEDLYMAILWPSAMGRAPGAALFSSPTKEYQQNSGLDANNDGKVTIAEATAQVRAKIK